METTTRHTPRIAALAAALVACLAMGFFAFVRQEQVPLLWAADLGFHELGHLLTMFWAPRFVTAAAGSFMQVAVPLGLAGYFQRFRRDRIGLSLMLAWAGISMANVAAYVADAPFQQLELLGGPGGHDWAFIFGPEALNNLSFSGPFSTILWICGAALLAAAVALCVHGIVAEVAAVRLAAYQTTRLETLPRHEPRNPVAESHHEPRDPVAVEHSRLGVGTSTGTRR